MEQERERGWKAYEQRRTKLENSLGYYHINTSMDLGFFSKSDNISQRLIHSGTNTVIVVLDLLPKVQTSTTRSVYRRTCGSTVNNYQGRNDSLSPCYRYCLAVQLFPSIQFWTNTYSINSSIASL